MAASLVTAPPGTVYAAEWSTPIGTTNDQPALQAMLNHIKATWGAGTLELPPGKALNIATGLFVPKGVRIHGDATSVLRYKGTTGVAVTINDGSCVPLRGLKITGPGAAVGTAVGLSVTGARMDFYDLEIRDFNRAIDITHAQTYILGFHGCRIGNAGTVLWGDIAGDSGSPAVANSGERILFDSCLIDNSGKLAHFSGNGSSLFFTNCSIDYLRHYGTYADAFVHFTGCHLESNESTLDGGYVMQPVKNARLWLTDSVLIMGAVKNLTDPAQGPWNLWGGRVQVAQTFFWCSAGSASAQHIYRVDATTAAPVATATLKTPWASKWIALTARMVGAEGVPESAAKATVKSVDAAAGTVTVAFSPPLTSTAHVRVDC